MAPVITPIKSFTNINTAMRSLRSGLGGIKTKTVKLNNILLKKTKVKRESIARNYILSQRRQESERRKNREDIIEASSIGGVFKRQAKAIASSTKGFLGRIMDFLGTLLVGWLMYNLPSIITMAQELIARIQRLYTIVTGFFNNTVKIFRGFGNVLGAIGKNILTFDFTDSNKRVENAIKDLNTNFDDMQSQFDEGFRLLTTSLGEGVASGVDAKPTGTQYPNESMQPGSSGSGGGGFSGTGVSKGTQISKRLQKDLGLKDYQAAAVVGNLLQENTNLVPDLLEGSKKGLLTDAMRKGIGYGWAQWTYPGRQKELYQLAQSMGVDPSKQPLTDEINYAMLVRELLRYDSGGRFRNSKNIEEASNWILFNYENPADKGKGEQSERIADSRKILKGMGGQAQTSAAQTLPPAPTSSPGLSFAKVASSLRGMSSAAGPGRGRLACVWAVNQVFKKAGMTPPWGTSDYVPTAESAMIKAGYQRIPIGQQMPGDLYIVAGQAHIGIVLPNGNIISNSSTGAKFSWEAPLSQYQSSYGGPGKFYRMPGGTASLNKNITQAQVASLGTQQRRQVSQQLSQQRNGPTIVVIEEDPPAKQQVSAGGGGAGMIPIIINPLNSFITKKLLLDLAYT